MLVSQTRYNDQGEAFETVDPAGMVTRTEFDPMGRTVRTIQNYQEGWEGAGDSLAVETAYLPGSRILTLTAINPTTGNQVTRYLYGTTLADSKVASNDLLVAEVYPDAQDALDRVTYTYNRQGERTSKRDQNGSVQVASVKMRTFEIGPWVGEEANVHP